jgi:hypothetical protein
MSHILNLNNIVLSDYSSKAGSNAPLVRSNNYHSNHISVYPYYPPKDSPQSVALYIQKNELAAHKDNSQLPTVLADSTQMQKTVLPSPDISVEE